MVVCGQKEELQTIGSICQKHHVLVVSDEIHQDIVFAPNTFVSFQTVDPVFADFSIVLTSATKTFNLAGIKKFNDLYQNLDLKNNS